MRHRPAFLLLASCLAFAPGPRTQVPAPPDPPATSPAPTADRAIEDWVRQLGHHSYRQRTEAEQQLRRIGEAALPALRKAAEHDDDGEVQWRARRLLRQIERGGAGGALVERLRAGAPPARPPMMGAVQEEWLRRPFDELFERIERDFGLDIPRAGFFADSFFRDLQEQLRQVRSRSQGMTVQIGPDGAVRVEATEKNDQGEVESKVYEAPSLEEFHEKFPGVLQRIGLGFGGLEIGGPAFGAQVFRGFIGRPGQGFDMQWHELQPRVLPFAQRSSPPAAADHGSPPSDRRLGVVVRDVPDEVRGYLGLDDGVGLMVDSVQAGSLAEQLGLQHNDIVVGVAGRPVGSPEDVQQALGGVGAGDKVEVEFLRRGERCQATAEKPKEKPKGDGKPLESRRQRVETIR